MAVIAQSYLAGPGKSETPNSILKQLSDPTLPSAWKMGLLDAVQPENRRDFIEAEVGDGSIAFILSNRGRPSKIRRRSDFSVWGNSGVFLIYEKNS